MFRWIQTCAVIIGAIFFINAPQAADKILVNDVPKAAGEWGFRPAEGKTIKAFINQLHFKIDSKV